MLFSTVDLLTLGHNVCCLYSLLGSCPTEKLMTNLIRIWDATLKVEASNDASNIKNLQQQTKLLCQVIFSRLGTLFTVKERYFQKKKKNMITVNLFCRTKYFRQSFLCSFK